MNGAARVARAFRGLEQRLQRGARAVLPAAVAERVDPALRRAAQPLRRGLATPLYLRHRIATWDGPCEGRSVRVACWAKRDAHPLLLPLFFEGLGDDGTPGPRTTWHEARWFRPAHFTGRGADAWLVETTPALAPRLRKAGFWIVPALVRYAAPLASVRAALERPGHSLRSDLLRIESRGLATRALPYDASLSRTFYARYLRAFSERRFGERGEPTTFAEVDRLFAGGFALAVERPGAPEPDALAILHERGGTLFIAKLGVRDGDVALARDGTLPAIYRGALAWAEGRGLERIDAGRSLPWRGHPGARYKQKWALRPAPDPTQTLEYGVRPTDPEGAVARRLAEEQLIVREPGGLRALTRDGLCRLDERLPTPGRGKEGDAR